MGQTAISRFAIRLAFCISLFQVQAHCCIKHVHAHAQHPVMNTCAHLQHLRAWLRVRAPTPFLQYPLSATRAWLPLVPRRGRLQYPMVRDDDVIIADPRFPDVSPPTQRRVGRSRLAHAWESTRARCFFSARY
eukprot:2026794-Pyramimonas_sp.AAC.1